MAKKEKLLLLGILAALAFSIFFSNFWSWAAYALEKAVALGFISVAGFAAIVTTICSVHFLL